METQTVIVLIIIAAALIYAGSILFKKAKSFAPKNSCGGDCGCEAKSKNS